MKDWWESVQQHAYDLLLARDAEGIVRYWSPGAERVLGWTSQEVVGRPWPGLEEGWNEAELPGKDGVLRALEGRSWRQDGHLLTLARDLTLEKLLSGQLGQLPRLEGLARVARGLAHDLNNALAPILLSASLLRWSLSGEDQELCDSIEAAAQKGAQLVQEMQTLARSQPSPGALCGPDLIVHQVARFCRETFGGGLTVLDESSPDVGEVVCDPLELSQGLTSLCLTARDAVGRDGQLTLSARNRDGRVEMRVSAKPARELPASSNLLGELAARFGAEVEGWRLEGDTLVYGLLWPTSDQGQPVPLPGGQGQLILLLDQPPIVALALRRNGYRVTEQPSDPAATALVNPDRSQIDSLLKYQPRLPIILSSSEGAGARAQAEALGIAHVLSRPYSCRSLLETVARALRQI